ncbi:MAG: M23 family metallopeptidase [Neisseriaceae bacterium]|nr:M23 family metallopeptidase [Neisseriaceae bacterium]MBP6860974.1 M23 family metallopeptidase [Neisseriaceae bacterium]
MAHDDSTRRWWRHRRSKGQTQRRLTITVSSVAGSRTYTAKENIKKKLYWTLGLMLGYCLLLTGAGVFLFDQYRHSALIWGQLQTLLDYKAGVEAEQIRQQQRFGIANINQTAVAKKQAFLQLVPNGSPLPDVNLQVTSGFGRRNHPVLGEIMAHNGLDIRAAIGTRVQATAAGMVSVAETQSGYGNVVKIEHAFGFQTVFAHLDKLLVQPGDLVKQGTIVAESGNTGRSTGPHLHYEVRFKNTPLDSTNFIRWNQQDFDYVFKNEKEVEWAFFVNEVI